MNFIKWNLSKIILLNILLILFFITMSTASSADLNMNSTNNTIANAVENQTNSGDTIYLDEGIYNHSHLNGTNGINISKNLTIIGKGADKTIINAEHMGRIFNTEPNINLILINISLINGNTVIDSSTAHGGAIYSRGSLLIKNCIFENNYANRSGGAILIGTYNAVGDLEIIDCQFINNTAKNNQGGAIFTWDSLGGHKLSITNSIFSNNKANVAGAIYIDHDNAIIINSTFTNNQANRQGGALQNHATNVSIINSIFTNNQVIDQNSSAQGGAIYNYANNLSIINSTFINNTATQASAIQNSAGNGSIVIGSLFRNNIGNSTIRIIGENVTIKSCDIYNNSAGIQVGNNVHITNNTIINYNRIFNNTDYDLNDIGNFTNGDYNWWGNNTPDKIFGITPNNYFVVNITNLTSLESNGTITFEYNIRLNTDEYSDNSLLPYFTTEAYISIINGIITSFDARYNRTFELTINKSGEVLYTFVIDNEVQTLKGNNIIPPEHDPPEPEPPNQDPIQDSSQKSNDSGINNNPTHDNDNNKVSASMKTTGLPINIILLMFLGIFLSYYRKQ